MATTTIPFERATVYEGAQVGIETTAGVIVPATKRLLGCQFDLDAQTNITMYRPQGSKANTTSFQSKETTDIKLTGHLCFNDFLYLGSTWLNSVSPVAPANNSTFTITGATGTLGFTYKGSVLTAASFASAAALQTAIQALASVGMGNVLVTSAGGGQYTIKFIAALSQDDSVISAITGTPTPVLGAVVTPTLTKRWVFNMNNFGPDAVNTLSIEKGARGVSGMSKNAGFCFCNGLSFKFNKGDASLDGGYTGQVMQDGTTLTTSSVTDVSLVPLAPKQTSVFLGSALNDPVNGLVRLTRALELDFGIMSRAGGIITLNDQDPSFSGRVETVPSLSARLTVAEDVQGMAILAQMRAGNPQVIVCENIGPLIETGYNYRWKAIMTVGFVQPNEGDTDGVVARTYDGELQYNSITATALQIIVDSPLSAL